MGLRIDRDRFDEEEYDRFTERLKHSLSALRELLDRPGFGAGERSLGAELELFLIDGAGAPLPLNLAVLRETVDPRITVELDRFNLECNLRWATLAGRPFSALEQELEGALAEVRRAAGAHCGRVAMIGILPTLDVEHLQRPSMTDLPRYRALSASLQRLRSAPFWVCIDGREPLEVSCNDVTFEGANTSLQVHLRVEPAEFARLYNAVQLATAPALAVSTNSPSFLGHELWEETRVALFKQSVDERQDKRGRAPRVGLGTGWVSEGAYELFAESVALHEPLLPILADEDPLATVRSGGVPALDEIRLHQGTVWSWNRAIYDPSGGGHLRIEMRALPAGPSVIDMAANAAFLVGLAFGLSQDTERWLPSLPFEIVESNFYRAAQHGLEAELRWPTPGGEVRAVAAPALVEGLLPVAERGLAEAGVDAGEAERLLEVIARRAASGQTGARWQRRTLAACEPVLGRRRALAAMLERYLMHAEGGAPVHEWPVDHHDGPLRVLLAPRGQALPEEPEAFLRWLGGPALLRVPGRDRSRTRVVSTLLHGNEPSGLRAVHAWLRSSSVPAVDVVFFIGAVAAALEAPGFAHRQLPGAYDLNRCFRPPFPGPEGVLAQRLLELLREIRPEALVDLHNNTGHSPAYGVGPRLGAAEIELAALFSDRYVHSDLRLGALVEATQAEHPSVTIECGMAGDPAADAVALAGLQRFLERPALGVDGPRVPVRVVKDPVRIEVRPGTRLVVGDGPVEGADLTLSKDIDRRNFEALEPGHPIGWLSVGAAWPLEAFAADGRELSRELFVSERGVLRTRRAMIPIMMTTDPRIALSDCLFYAVQPAVAPAR